jgi:hypothetical protein
MTLPTVPLRFEAPKARSPNAVDVTLEQAQPGEGDQLDLERSQNRLLRPGVAFLHPQALLGSRNLSSCRKRAAQASTTCAADSYRAGVTRNQDSW